MLPAYYTRSPTLPTLKLTHTHTQTQTASHSLVLSSALLSRSVALFQAAAAAARCYSPSTATSAATETAGAAARHLLVGRAHNSFCGFIVCLCPFVLPCKCADKNKICKTLNESRYTHAHSCKLCVCVLAYIVVVRSLIIYIFCMASVFCLFSLYFLVVVGSCFCSCLHYISFVRESVRVCLPVCALGECVYVFCLHLCCG